MRHRLLSRVSRKPVNNPGKAPKQSNFKGKDGKVDKDAYAKAKANYAAAEKTGKENSDYNTKHDTAIRAWENYDKIQGMTAGSTAMGDQ